MQRDMAVHMDRRLSSKVVSVVITHSKLSGSSPAEDARVILL